MRLAVVNAIMMWRLACGILTCFSYVPERIYLGGQNEQLTGIVDFNCVDVWYRSRWYCNFVWMLTRVGKMSMQGLH